MIKGGLIKKSYPKQDLNKEFLFNLEKNNCSISLRKKVHAHNFRTTKKIKEKKFNKNKKLTNYKTIQFKGDLYPYY